MCIRNHTKMSSVSKLASQTPSQCCTGICKKDIFIIVDHVNEAQFEVKPGDTDIINLHSL